MSTSHILENLSKYLKIKNEFGIDADLDLTIFEVDDGWKILQIFSCCEPSYIKTPPFAQKLIYLYETGHIHSQIHVISFDEHAKTG